MAITLEQIRTRDAQRRADATPPDPDPSSSSYPFEPRFDLHGIADGQTIRYDESQRRMVPANAGDVGGISGWVTGAPYTRLQVVVVAGSLYQAVDDHTAGATFSGDSAHWSQLDSETDGLALAQLATHVADSTGVHGIADTSVLVVTSDGRLSNARVPTAHKTSHATGGSDPLTPADIGAATTSAVTAEASARASGDGAEASARAAAIGVEATTRSDADDAETAARIAADTSEATTRAAADTAETAARIAADALKADLVSGKVPTSQLPALATNEWVPVADQAAMLALTSSQVQIGDGAIRADLSGRRFLLMDADPSILGHWIPLETPDAVTTVNGMAGTVVLGAADVGAPTAGALTAETSARTSADSTESAARIAADSAESTARASADTAEATARATADALLAPLASPVLTGSPRAPTQIAGDDSTKIATTAFVAAAAGRFFGTDEGSLSGSTALDVQSKPFRKFSFVLGGNTDLSFTNILADTLIWLAPTQDGSGLHTLAVNGVDIGIDYGANKPSTVLVYYDGTGYRATGQKGDTGDSGGAITIPYTFSTTTTDADPGAGVLRLNNATQNAATVIRTDLADNRGGDWTAALDSLDDSTNSTKGHIRLAKFGDASKWLLFKVTGLASPSGYRNVAVVPVSSSASSPFANGDKIVMLFTPAGDGGGMAQSTADATYARQPKGLFLSVAVGLSPAVAAGLAIGTNKAWGARFQVPHDCTNLDVAFYVTVQSGNLIVGVYDTGQSNADHTIRTKIIDSGSVAVAAANAWQKITLAQAFSAGDEIEIVVAFDNATAAIGKAAVVSNAAANGLLPTGFLPPHGAGAVAPKTAVTVTLGSFALPATVTEANWAVQQTPPALIARAY